MVKVIQLKEDINIKEISECLNEWKSRYSTVIKDFKIKEYESINNNE